MKYLRQCPITLWIIGLFCISVAACVTGPALTDHAFSFDTRVDSPGIVVIQYRYGDSQAPGARTTEDALQHGRVSVGTNTNGPMLRGDYLYVKWRVMSSGAVYEDTVDLRHRLPRNITRHRIHFAIKENQLFVYLISPDKRPTAWPAAPLSMYSDLKVFTIYPDPAVPNKFD
jgi:hypothetical protein